MRLVEHQASAAGLAVRTAGPALLWTDVREVIVSRALGGPRFRAPGIDLGSCPDCRCQAPGTGRLVLAGIATSGVVLSTLRQAADLDYQLTVLPDGCLDPDPEVHELLLGKVFPPPAQVTTIADWADRLHQPAPSADDH